MSCARSLAVADARELERLLSDARAEIDVLRQSEAKFRAAFETMIEACCVFDMIYDDFGRPVDWRIVEANAGYEQQSGLKDVAGRLASEFMPGTEPYWIEMFGRVVETGVAEQIEKWHQPTGRWVHSSTARVGGSGSRRLVSVFYDITERKRAEIALRESENRFQQFANASSSGLWIRDAETLRMEFVSPSIATIYGTEPDALLGDIKYWAAMVLPEDRETAGHHIEQACHGDPAIHEFRIRRDDGSFRWIRDTDFPLFDENGNVQRVGGIAEDVTETKMAVEHQGVLLHELQHRVRNIMAVIRSIAVRSADGAADVEDYKTSLAGRLLALARVQTLLTRQANAGGWMRDILESEIGAQAHSENQYELTGPDIMLSPKAVEVLTLAFHELSTNALKYGALSVSRGKVTVTWTLFEKREKTWIAIDWVEEGAPSRAPPTRRGFGSELIEARIPYELRGTGKTTIEPEGARCHIEFPLREAESILETDAPVPTRLYGGTVDMTGAPDLSGKTILVVEDDYYVASDTAAALRGAGAIVLGPSPTAEDAAHLLEHETPTSVVLDLNLGGGGPKFEIAHRLLERGIPFVFLTGYDPDVIPDDLANIKRLQKPIALREVVEAVSRL
nr:PAS domain S-box protein [Rhizobium sp. BK379]